MFRTYTERSKECVRWNNIGYLGASRIEEKLQVCVVMNISPEPFLHSWYQHQTESDVKSNWRLKVTTHFCSIDKCLALTHMHSCEIRLVSMVPPSPYQY
jgi:hypothetical protein